MTRPFEELAHAAWEARENAHVLGSTAVGCAVASETGAIFVGCNVQHKYRSHDIHAETNAIGTMVAGGGEKLIAVFVAAERDRFTPCGACMDWIFEFGGADCIVMWQSTKNGSVGKLTAAALMPYYPE